MRTLPSSDGAVGSAVCEATLGLPEADAGDGVHAGSVGNAKVTLRGGGGGPLLNRFCSALGRVAVALRGNVGGGGFPDLHHPPFPFLQ